MATEGVLFTADSCVEFVASRTKYNVLGSYNLLASINEGANKVSGCSAHPDGHCLPVPHRTRKCYSSWLDLCCDKNLEVF